MQEVYFVAHDGEPSGPFSLEEIVKRIESRQLETSDYIYDEAIQDWVVLMAYAPLASRIRPAAPPAAISAEVRSIDSAKANASAQGSAISSPKDASAEWYVLKGDNKFGPFAYLDLVKMLQEKSLFEFDYVWHLGLAAWKRIAELSEFSPDAIRGLKDSQVPGLTEVFFRRRHARVSHGSSILVHDNKTVWKGRSVEVSGGGAGISVDNAVFQPGQIIYLHFKPANDLPAFNATCEVVNVRSANGENTKANQYGVKFLNLTQQTQKDLKELTLKRQAAA